jgi:hypothetical protein
VLVIAIDLHLYTVKFRCANTVNMPPARFERTAPGLGNPFALFCKLSSYQSFTENQQYQLYAQLAFLPIPQKSTAMETSLETSWRHFQRCPSARMLDAKLRSAPVSLRTK